MDDRGENGALTNNWPQSFEHVLANINKLNRSLEGVIAVSCLQVYERKVETELD